MQLFDRDAWRRRRETASEHLIHICWVSLAYLLSELLIWGLSRVLAPVDIEFFSPVIGMVVIFICMGAAYLAWRSVGKIYRRWIRPKVDFINTHMGVGFTVPIIMLNQNDILNGRDIACILANAVITNVISWALVFLLSYVSWSAYLRYVGFEPRDSAERGIPTSLAVTPPRIHVSWYPGSSTDQVMDEDHIKPSRPGTATPSASATASASLEEARIPSSPSLESPIGQRRRSCMDVTWPMALAIFCIFVIGAPVAASTHDSRLLDGFVLWLVWITAVTAQRTFKFSERFLRHPRFKNSTSTMLNPVLITTLAMVGYTRLKAEVMGGDLVSILGHFSAGSPLFSLWTASTRGIAIPTNPGGWFGAGDAALSLLECGIFMWGFKLFECRRQLFSAAGALAVLVSIIAAAGNVFLSVLAGRAMGLERPEALAFAARSTTLALAKPAIEAVGGNTVVNAALVVGNGIFGQLMYPFALGLLGVKTEDRNPTELSIQPATNNSDREKHAESQGSCESETWMGQDDASTVASGIAIGINGAAMGVAYLYETRSQAAPYAALSMTVFGVATVILTTVGPFKALLLSLGGN
ncbi:hypothetical protein NLU13_2547 [Sarocladium strictum]|uniref:LrgB-like protein n=1 Tax=Sarocladium strictum TaxID=5046 RepID=A0AA39L9K6_SARSR|nr:hypothetical protein NLU13_2547 [Sarocladium strictum]